MVSPLNSTQDRPARTGKVYRYRGPMKATPVAKAQGTAASQSAKSRKKHKKARNV